MWNHEHTASFYPLKNVEKAVHVIERIEQAQSSGKHCSGTFSVKSTPVSEPGVNIVTVERTSRMTKATCFICEGHGHFSQECATHWKSLRCQTSNSHKGVSSAKTNGEGNPRRDVTAMSALIHLIWQLSTPSGPKVPIET